MDQAALEIEFKYDGEEGAKDKQRELEKKEYTKDEIKEEKKKEEDKKEADADEEDDFDAEAEDIEEPEEEATFEKEELPVKVTGSGVNGTITPVYTWDDAVARGILCPPVRTALGIMTLEKPTLIQRFTLPLIAKAGVDMLAQAQTGSGKTLAFAIPIVSRLVANPPVP